MIKYFFFLFLSTSILGNFSNAQVQNQNIEDQSIKLLQFSKIYKTCRYFYPTDNYSDYQWDSLLLDGVSTVLESTNDDYLRNMNEFFAYYFPLITFNTQNHQNIKRGKKEQVFWQYLGFSESEHPIYKKRLINSGKPISSSGMQFWLDNRFDLTDVKMTLSCTAKNNNNKSEELLLRIEAFNYKTKKDSTVEKLSSLSKLNSTYSLEHQFNQGQSYITFLIGKKGKGEVQIDNIEYSLVLKDSIIEKGSLDLNHETINQIPNVRIRNPYGVSFSLKNGLLTINSVKGENESWLYAQHPLPNSFLMYQLSNNSVIKVPISIDKRTYQNEKHRAVRQNQYSEQCIHLAALIKSYCVLSTFFPYTEDLNIDHDNLLLKYLPQMLDWESSTKGYKIVQKYFAEFKDGHAYVHNDLDLSTRCVKADFARYKNNIFVVGSDTACQLKYGDQLIYINNESINDILNQNVQTRSGSEQWKYSRESFLIGCGDSSKVDKYSIIRLEDTLDFNVKKDWYAGQYNEPANKKIELIDSGIYYLDASRVSYNEFLDTISALNSSQGIIVDLREYPKLTPQFLTHFSDSVLYSNWWFIPKVYASNEKAIFDSISPWELSPTLPRIATPVVFLTGSKTISYAESLLDIIKKYNLGKVIGTISAGANGNKTQFTFCEQYKFYFTGMNVKRSDGKMFFSKGIEPDLIYEENFNYNRNDLINYAISYFKSIE